MITLGVVAAVVAWRAFLVVAVRPLASLAYDEGDTANSWKKWVLHRRITTVAVVIALALAGVLWGKSLGTDFLNSPKLRASTYVWATASTTSPVNGQSNLLITVSRRSI